MAAIKTKAKGIGIKVPKKTVVIRSTVAEDEKYMGEEPVWDTERALAMPKEEFDKFLAKSLTYYSYFFSAKELKKYVVTFLEKETKMSKDQIAIYKQSDISDTPATLCGIVKAHTMGMPMREHNLKYIIDIIENICSKNVYVEPVIKTAKQEVYKPTIQDRMNEKLSFVLGDIEGEIDLVFTNKETKVKFYDLIVTHAVPQASIGKVAALIGKHKSELEEAITGECEQLKEAYSYLSKKDVKRIVAYLEAALADLESYKNLKKTLKKAKVKKPANKAKVVSKVKYCKEFKPLKLASVDPVTIIGSQEVWCYETKKRKLIRYIADSHSGTLGIKGTSIVGFEESKSVMKTLRKPEEQLKEFFKSGKVQLRTFIENIKAVETKATGRLNADTVILKVQ